MLLDIEINNIYLEVTVISQSKGIRDRQDLINMFCLVKELLKTNVRNSNELT